MARSVRADPTGSVELLLGLQRVTAALARALTPEDVAQVVVDQGLPLLGASGGGVSFVTRSGRLRLLRALGTPAEVAAAHRAMSSSAPFPVAEAVSTRRPVWLESPEAIEARYPGIGAVREDVRARAWVAVPLSGRGQVTGVLGLRFAEARSFDEGDRAFILTLAEVCGQALDRAFLHRREERSAERERAARERVEMASVALAESESLFRACADQAPYGFAIFDSKGRFQFANAGAEALAGQGAGQLRGKRSEEVLDPSFLAVHLPAIQRVISTGQTQTLDWEAADGRTFAVSYAPIRRPGGGIDNVIASAFDFTERGALLAERERLVAESRAHREILEAERARHEAADRASRAEKEASELQAVLDAHGGGIVMLSSEGVVLRMNEAARVILGISPADVPTVTSLIERIRLQTERGQPVPLQQTLFAQVLQSGEPGRERLVIVQREDGTRRWLLARAVPVHPGGAVRAVVVGFADVTALRELREGRDDLVRAVSRDLGSPLDDIVRQARLIGTGAEPPLRAQLESIAGSAERVSGALRDLGRMGSPGRRGRSPAPELVDVKAFLLDLLERTRVTLAVERVSVSAPPGLPRVRIDPDDLDRVMRALLANALEYSAPDGPVAVECREHQGAVVLSVADRGPGIPSDELPRIFERFYRGRNARSAGGLGLGLYLARALVEGCGGHLTVESEPGKGSTFRVSLPAAQP